MAEPIIFVVDPDPEALAWIATALQRRFGADYRIETDDNPASAIMRLEQACERGDSVALVIGGAPFEWLEERAPSALETSVSGIFAAGDVRHRSPRNVAAAVADGAIAVRSVYEYLHKVG